MKLPISVLAIFSCGACVTGTVSQQAPRAATSTGVGASQQTNSEQPLAMVDGKPLNLSSLSAEAQERVRSTENELQQRKLHALWVGIEEAIEAQLLEREASRRGMSTGDLEKAEIDSKLAQPTDEEVKELYEANKSLIQLPFEQVESALRDRLTQRERDDVEAAFLNQLRESIEIEYSLPIPELPRYEVSSHSQPVQGPDSAPVTLIEFSDFECPFCARGRTLVSRLKEIYSDSLRVVFRDFPLRQHRNARPAAEAAECAHKQKKFWPYHDKLFDNGNALGPDDLRSYAEAVGLDMGTFEECLRSGEAKQAVEFDEREGNEIGVDGTPAIFVNGIKLVGLLPMPLMRAIIDSEIKRKSQSM